MAYLDFWPSPPMWQWLVQGHSVNFMAERGFWHGSNPSLTMPCKWDSGSWCDQVADQIREVSAGSSSWGIQITAHNLPGLGNQVTLEGQPDSTSWYKDSQDPLPFLSLGNITETGHQVFQGHQIIVLHPLLAASCLKYSPISWATSMQAALCAMILLLPPEMLPPYS